MFGDDRKSNAHHPSQPVINSVENALEVILMLRTHPSIRASEVGSRLGVSRSTAHRLLATLTAHGLIEQDSQNRTYHVGPALLEIALSAAAQTDVVRTLHPFLRELSQEVGETAHTVVLEGASCLFADSVESGRALRTTARIGTRYPAYVVSGGKALLAELHRDRLLALFPAPELPALNPRSLTSRDALLAELDQIRERGYATNFGESELGIAAVAVAQRTMSGSVPAALAISAPETRLPRDRVPALVEALMATAERARARLP